MNESHDLEVALRSELPLIVIDSHEELRVSDMLLRIASGLEKPLYKWSISDGLLRLGSPPPQSRQYNDATAVLDHIREQTIPACYLLADFHPFLEQPLRVRLLKDIALQNANVAHTIILLSHHIEIPNELSQLTMRFALSLPGRADIEKVVSEVAEEWLSQTEKQVTTDRSAFDLLVKNLSGLSLAEARRLARTAIFDDGAITETDATDVMKAKHELLNRDSVLSFEYDTASFSDIAGLHALKTWLKNRRVALDAQSENLNLEQPKGILLLGVQGCGKSLAAKAVAGTWGIPLLRFDFGAIYQKYIGETEKNLRGALRSAELMAPCVLWLDEIEKGLSTGDSDGGTSRRILGTLLTWMSEKSEAVFIVATANDIEQLPPELIRKGRFDEIFFVDLPSRSVREAIFKIHLEKRNLHPDDFDLKELSAITESFSGAEIEQTIVSTIYTCVAQETTPSTEILRDEISRTKPLATIMAEKIQHLRSWAADRTVRADDEDSESDADGDAT